MWQYYILLRQRENLPVIPIALVFYPARDGITREEDRESVFGEIIVTFHYLQISLPRLSAQDYVQLRATSRRCPPSPRCCNSRSTTTP